MKVAVVGATGLVGSVMLKVLAERRFPVSELVAAASERSVGKMVEFNGQQVPVVSVADAVAAKPAVAIFSAGSSTSREWAPRFAEVGTYVVDNSSCWRMDAKVPLVVPEVNPDAIEAQHRIIANPNCSTIQLMVALRPLQHKFGIRRIVISTYQSVTGTGVKAVRQLHDERAGRQADMAYPHPIDLNCFPHGGEFLPNGYTTEEQKLIDETRKILGNNSIQVSPTVVRVPVLGGHSEAVNVELLREFDLDRVLSLLRTAPGLVVLDDPSHNLYPMPRMAEGRDEVFVGRIRRDPTQPNTLNMWVVSDNLRKGAATNAVQIAELLLQRGLLR